MAPGVSIKSTVPLGSHAEASVQSGPTNFVALGMAFAGTTGESGITAILYDCAEGYPEEFPNDQSNYIALIERSPQESSFLFSQKVLNAQSAGAIGVIIYNNVVDDLDQNGGTLGVSSEWLPAVSVTQADGLALKGTGVHSVTLTNRFIDPASSFAYKQGTSMAVPIVSGVAALLMSFDPTLTYSQIKTAILNTVDKVPAAAGKMVSEGRLNARSALCSINPVSGDVSCDNSVGLEDVIIAMQVLSRVAADICPTCTTSGIDVNGDTLIGIEEAVYILQKVSGLREE